MQLELSDKDRRTFTKLYASADDIAVARRWAEHIQKKRWFRQPWSGGKIYLHQSAYVTALVVAYGRVFAVGRGGFDFPKRLIPYDAAERDLHERLIELRNKVHAHSDLDKWNVRPWHAAGFSTAIVGQPKHMIEEADIALFLVMTEKLLEKIASRKEEILQAYIAGHDRGPTSDPLDRASEAMGELGVGESLMIRFKEDGSMD